MYDNAWCRFCRPIGEDRSTLIRAGQLAYCGEVWLRARYFACLPVRTYYADLRAHGRDHSRSDRDIGRQVRARSVRWLHAGPADGQLGVPLLQPSLWAWRSLGMWRWPRTIANAGPFCWLGFVLGVVPGLLIGGLGIALHNSAARLLLGKAQDHGLITGAPCLPHR